MKRLLSLLLVCSLALPFPALGVEWTGESYEEQVAVLRQTEIYAIEATLDTEWCSVFLYRRIGTPHVQYNQIKIIYKPGSPQGDGASAGVTFREEDKALEGLTVSPDAIELSEDQKSFTYTNFDPDIGTDYYTVDLATGVATVKRVSPTQEQLVDWFVRQGLVVEDRLEGSLDTAVLFSSTIEREGKESKDCFLYLFSRNPERADPERWYRRLLLPSTVTIGSKNPDYPTDRGPDFIELSEDGSTFTYVYRFEDALFNAEGAMLHDAGTYTYVVDLASGELEVTHTEGLESSSPALQPEGTTFVDMIGLRPM